MSLVISEPALEAAELPVAAAEVGRTGAVILSVPEGIRPGVCSARRSRQRRLTSSIVVA